MSGWSINADPGTADTEGNPFIIAEGIEVAVVLDEGGIPNRLRIYDDQVRHPTWPPYGAIFEAIAERWPDNEVSWEHAFHGPWQPRNGYVETYIEE